MAELLGVRVWSYDFTAYAGSFAWSALLPFNPMEEYGLLPDPKGVFVAQVLGAQHVPSQDKVLKLRPTGNDNSGPYFHAVLSGYNGVRSAGGFQLRHYNGDYRPYRSILECNLRNEGYYTNGMYTYHYYSRYLSDGDTAIAAGLIVADHGFSGGECFVRGFTKHRASGPIGLDKWVSLHSWDYRQASGIPEESFSFYQAKLDYFIWSILTGARSGLGIDPELTHRWYSAMGVPGEPIKVVYDELHFDHGELEAFNWWELTGQMEGKYRALGGQAYYNACSSLPKATTNSIANVLEGASTLASAFKGDFGALVPTTPKDAWLFYRYQYTTSKLDVEEYVSTTKRLAALAAMPGIRSDGSAYSDGISCHCVIKADPSAMIPNSVKDWLASYGFELTWLNVWDMIPYSFVVDWFFHIGTFLEVCEQENWAYTLPIQESWTSFSTHGPGPQRTYFRVPGFFRAACPFLDYRQRGASGKTITKRILDSIALFT